MARRFAKVTYRVPPEVLNDGIDAGEQRFRVLLEEEMLNAADQLEAHVQNGNHRWTNRTGAAEREFRVEVERGGLRMVASHGVFYGVFLEFKDGGRWGVIPDLMRYGAPIIQRGLQRAVTDAWR